MQISEIGHNIIKLRIAGYSLKKIKTELKCSSSTISKYINSLKLNNDIISQNIIMAKEIKTNSHIIGLTSSIKTKEIELLRIAKPLYPSQTNTHRSRLREATKQFLISPVNGKCQCCGYDKCIDGLSFHHKDKLTKHYNISGSVLTRNINILIVEAAKCILVCHNCHSEIHCGIRSDTDIETLQYHFIPNNVIEWYVNKIGTINTSTPSQLQHTYQQ